MVTTNDSNENGGNGRTSWYFVAAKVAWSCRYASANRFVNLIGPFDTHGEADGWKRTVIESADELGIHPAEIEVIHRGGKRPGILNQHFGVTSEQGN